MTQASTKHCSGGCGRDLPLDAFWHRKTGKVGPLPQCKDCMKRHHANWRADKKEALAAKTRAWYAEDVERGRTACRRYRRENPDKERARAARGREALCPSYVARTLGLALSECPPELVGAQRAKLTLRRVLG